MKPITLDYVEFLKHNEGSYMKLRYEDAKLYCFSLGYRLPNIFEIEQVIEYYISIGDTNGYFEAMCTDEDGNPVLVTCECGEYEFTGTVLYDAIEQEGWVYPVRDMDLLAFAA